MKLVVPREAAPGETRVALVPETVKKLIAAGFSVSVESGAGLTALFSDDAYRAAGATIVNDPEALFSGGDMIL
jgi:NAD(P) transhydrogenase subunit alpha